jgi:hypothetical protein
MYINYITHDCSLWVEEYGHVTYDDALGTDCTVLVP